MRRERICRISSVDLEYPSLSLTRRNWLSLGVGQWHMRATASAALGNWRLS